MCGLSRRDDVVLRLRREREPRLGPVSVAAGLMFGSFAAATLLPSHVPEPAHALDALAVATILGAVVASVMLLGGEPIRGDVVTVTRHGVYPSSRSRRFIPGWAIETVEVRQWTLAGPWRKYNRISVNLGLRLVDGRRVILPPLEHRRAAAVRLLAGPQGGEWRLLTDDHGAAVTWSHGNGDQIATLVQARIFAVMSRAKAVGTSAGAVELGALGDDRRGLGSALRATRRASAVPEPAQPEPPRTKTAPRTGDAVPDWRDFTIPATYTSRANEAIPGVPGMRRQAVRFELDGLVLVRRASEVRIAYADVRAFSIELTWRGDWAPAVLMVDGSVNELPGLGHGPWNAVLYTEENAVLWRRAPHDQPGSLRWHGPDDDDLVVARLNEQLDYARAAQKRATVSSEFARAASGTGRR